MPLFQVPAARAHEEHRDLLVQLVLLSRGRIGIGNRAPDGIAQIDLAVDQVVPRRRVGVLEIGHENLRAGVQRVDDHLAVHGPGNLHAAVENVGGQRRHASTSASRICFCFGEKVGLLAGIEPLLPLLARVEQRFAPLVERALQVDDKGDRLRRQDLGIAARCMGREFQHREDRWQRACATSPCS